MNDNLDKAQSQATLAKIFKGLAWLGAVFAAIGVWLVWQAVAVQRWPVVAGRIDALEVAGRISRVSDAVHRRIEYLVRMEYSYTVDGVAHTGSRYAIGDGDRVAGYFNDRSEARAWLHSSPFKVGDAIDVHVDPDNPDSAVIDSAWRLVTLVPFMLAGLLVLPGWLFRRVQRTHSEASP